MGLGLILWAGLARGGEHLGLPVSQVAIEAASGELPDEDLLPLLQAQQGSALDDERLASDVAVLESTGAFESVQVHTELWSSLDDEGQPMASVRVTYVVRAAPRLRRLELEGARGRLRRSLLLAAGVSRGDRLTADEQERVGFRVLQACAEVGLEGSSVELHRVELPDGRVDLRVQLEPGTQARVGELGFAGDLGLRESTLRRVAAGAGLEEGGLLVPGAAGEVARALEDALVEAGHLSARVSPVVQDAPGPVRAVGFVVAAGPRVEVRIEGLPRIHHSGLIEGLRLSSEARLDRVDAEVLQARAEDSLAELGYLDGRALVEVDVDGERLLVELSVEPGVRYRLGRLDFQGSAHHDPVFLEAAYLESSPSVLARRRVTPGALEAAGRATERTYRAEGFLEARLQVVELNRRGRRVDVVVQVDEGPVTTLRALSFVGGQPELVSELQGRGSDLLGGPYRGAEVRELADEVVRAHRQAGYPDATARLKVSVEGGQADVVVLIEAGDRVFLRNLIVVGTERTRLSVVHREVQLETGQPLIPAELDEARSELYDLGAFRSVELRLEGQDPPMRDLVLVLEEQPTWSTQLSAGLATDEGLRTYGRVTRRHVFGLAHSVSLVGQVGLGYQGDSWQLDLSAPEWRAGLRYEAPHAPSPDQRTWLELLANERAQEPTYRLSRTGAALGVETELGLLRVSTSYALQWRWLEDVDPGALVGGDPWLSAVASDGELGPRRQGTLRVQSLLDRRDDPFDPRQGALLALEVDLADPVLTRATWMRAQGRAQQWLGLGPLTGLVEVQAGLGLVPGLGTTLPLEERFRLGGAGSLRGYPLDQVGPKMRVADQDLDWPSSLGSVVDLATRDDPQRWVPTGGDAMAQATAELHVPMPLLGFRRWTSGATVVFVDVGNTWFVDPAVYATSEVLDPEPLLRYGFGFGLRQATPVGPLQLDLGANPLYYTTEWAAARGEVPLRLHVSLGTL